MGGVLLQFLEISYWKLVRTVITDSVKVESVGFVL